MMDFGKVYVITGMIFIVVAIIMLMGLVNQQSICNSVCDEKQALGRLVVPSGEWFDLGKEDACLCFYENRTEKIK